MYLTVLENAQYCWDAILHCFIFLGKLGASGEGLTAAIHMKRTRKQHISLYCEKGLGVYTAYTISTFKQEAHYIYYFLKAMWTCTIVFPPPLFMSQWQEMCPVDGNQWHPTCACRILSQNTASPTGHCSPTSSGLQTSGF